MQAKSPMPPIVPQEFAGKWIAWDRMQTRIVAHGRTFAAAKQAAVAVGEPDAVLAKVPKADVRFVGGAPCGFPTNSTK